MGGRERLKETPVATEAKVALEPWGVAIVRRGPRAELSGEWAGSERVCYQLRRGWMWMAPNGNIGLFERYRDAWRRINSAIKLGFYFEAIAIEESILSNRIISFLYGVRKLGQVTIRGRSPRFVCLIKLWREACEESRGYWQNPGDLIDRVNAWRAKRNDAVHALTRAFPGEALQSVFEYS